MVVMQVISEAALMQQEEATWGAGRNYVWTAELAKVTVTIESNVSSYLWGLCYNPLLEVVLWAWDLGIWSNPIKGTGQKVNRHMEERPRSQLDEKAVSQPADRRVNVNNFFRTRRFNCLRSLLKGLVQVTSVVFLFHFKWEQSLDSYYVIITYYVIRTLKYCKNNMILPSFKQGVRGLEVHCLATEY